jgi:hypothetical protein
MARDKQFDSDAEDVLASSRKLAQKLGTGNQTWFGMKLDSDMRNMVNPFWLAGMSYIQGQYRNPLERGIGNVMTRLKADKLVEDGKVLSKLPLFKRVLSNPKYIATTFFGLLAAAPLFPAILSPITQWREDRADMVHTLAPVLKDMQKDGLPSGLGSIDVTDNEVIFAHRKRLNNTVSHYSINNLLAFGSSQLSLAIQGMAGKKQQGAPLKNQSTAQLGKRAAEAAAKGDMSGFIHTLPGGVDMVVNRYTKGRSKEFHIERDAVSAYELITQLNDEIKESKSDNLMRDDFSYPRKMGNRSDHLKSYISNIIKLHAKDMARLMPDDYAELRSGLNEEREAVATVLAEAIADGGLPTLSLVRLMGEGHVIKQNGRGLVDAEDLKRELVGMTENLRDYAQVSPEEYMKMVAFTEKEARETLSALAPEDRSILASMMPSSVLKKAGMSDEEITQVRTDTAPIYEKNLANLIAGIASQPEQDLKAQGMAAAEIKTLQDAAKAIEKGGLKAVHHMRANANKPVGIEHQVINAAMSQVAQPDYLGKMLHQGEMLLDKSSHAASSDKSSAKTSKSESGKQGGKHAQRLSSHQDTATAETGQVIH